MPLIGCSNQSPRYHDDCFEDGEPNRITNIAFVRKGTSISMASETSFKTDILAAELAGNAVFIRKTNGTKGAPSIKEGKGAGLQIKSIVGKEHSITAIDKQYIKNVPFWNDFENNASNYDLYYWTTNYVWKTIPTSLFVAVGDPITDDITTFMEASFTVTWSQKSNPIPYPSQAIDFETSQQLAFTSLTAGTGTNEAIISGSNLTLSGVSDDVSIQVNFTPAAVTYELEEGSVLPTGVTLSATGQLAGNITTNGVYNFTVIGRTATGVAGMSPIKITRAS